MKKIKRNEIREKLSEIISDISIAGKTSYSPDEEKAIDQILKLIEDEVIKENERQ